MDIGEWIQGLPKVELHLHLEGSLRPATLFALARRHGVDLGVGSAEQLGDLYRFDGFDDFAWLFLAGLDVLRGAEDFADATLALAAELAAQNVRYAEVTTTPFQHHRRGVALEEYVAGLDEGRRRARDEHGVEIGWICDISRETEAPDSHFTVDFLLGRTAPQGVVGLGLGGVEHGFPPEMFASSFAKAKAGGLASLPHAGETAGPESIWGALRSLKADRIGHGIRCVDDPALVAWLAERRIPLEVAPTSNVVLKLVKDLESHMLGELARAGVVVTINTDDPAYFQTTLNAELRAAHDLHGFTRQALLDVQDAALQASYAPAEIRSAVRRELDQIAP
ncbi:adenosine deaminase [Actinomadura darangshiensis]|uniref:Adenosine deaminase n=1 Tax=Actinomadura darangshiensis TaxID=705336 RepID=A0A4R5BCS0_9ACTN|nr:adenosine deaminase [Actinomadura darangshiensis]TDD81332.1 adenosine deaminase [Actinomadura darangshiensis]